jgi:hypothetical protein
MTGGDNETFLYFAYGSNLWTKRIHENNRSAEMKSTALLKVRPITLLAFCRILKSISACNLLPMSENFHVLNPNCFICVVLVLHNILIIVKRDLLTLT